ncbi:MAG: hypothetical protein B7733_05570 [Myxococcales bacterium FL481]|nr:MAG: hypothetical protein B7733_05570 [Myxococcales bacterium FL481]
MSASNRTVTLDVITPLVAHELERVVHVRFDSGDGSRGVLPGHERATAYVREGAVTIRTLPSPRDNKDLSPRESFVATDGGTLVIGPDRLVLLTSWAAVAGDLAELAAVVRTRTAHRERLETAARTLRARHETALRRALVRLEREVSW